MTLAAAFLMPVVMLGLVFFLARIEERHLGGPPPAADTEARRSGGTELSGAAEISARAPAFAPRRPR